jgi:hypothetical protein
MATATIHTLLCIQPATGTDLGANQALMRLPEAVLAQQYAQPSALAALRALPEVVSAIDAARADPDDLYVTSGTTGDRALAIWPAAGQSVVTRSDQSHAPGITLEFGGHSQNLSLWDYDSGSRDDLLGSVTMLASEQGRGEIAKLAKSQVEGSAYYVIYQID